MISLLCCLFFAIIIVKFDAIPLVLVPRLVNSNNGNSFALRPATYEATEWCNLGNKNAMSANKESREIPQEQVHENS